MGNESFTLIVVPDHHQPVKRYRIQRRFLFQLGAAVLVLVGVLAVATFRYLRVARDAAENRILRDENLTLRSQLKSIRERVDHIGSTLDRVERFDQKLRSLTVLPAPPQPLPLEPTPAGTGTAAGAPPRPPGSSEPVPSAPSGSLGPSGLPGSPFDGLGSSPPGSPASSGSPGSFSLPLASAPSALAELPMSSAALSSDNPRVLGFLLDRLSAEATRQEQSLQELQAYFQDQRSQLDSMPSTWPTRGWVTSDFGTRLDPYTADRVMHAGLDIAGPHGKEVSAPSDGKVVFAGLEGGYGNVLVIDHGFGIKTRYGHLARILVKPGDRVKRGALIATLGNTGRSTGPHLHYEVRVNGLPENPRKFILDE